ncbi:unnamed protein product [Closterium sp. Naga37s-1]|nr:unnamed protein product [Closterium sp. Naga37s-1]
MLNPPPCSFCPVSLSFPPLLLPPSFPLPNPLLPPALTRPLAPIRGRIGSDGSKRLDPTVSPPPILLSPTPAVPPFSRYRSNLPPVPVPPSIGVRPSFPHHPPFTLPLSFQGIPRFLNPSFPFLPSLPFPPIPSHHSPLSRPSLSPSPVPPHSPHPTLPFPLCPLSQ